MNDYHYTVEKKKELNKSYTIIKFRKITVAHTHININTRALKYTYIMYVMAKGQKKKKSYLILSKNNQKLNILF